MSGRFSARRPAFPDPDRPHRDVDARAIEQARVAERMRFIDAPAHRRDDLVDDAEKMRLVLEPAGHRLQQAAKTPAADAQGLMKKLSLSLAK